MARSGEALLYERIPAFRLQIQSNVEDLIRKAESETESSTLGDFYVQHLRAFLPVRRSRFPLSAARGRSCKPCWRS